MCIGLRIINIFLLLLIRYIPQLQDDFYPCLVYFLRMKAISYYDIEDILFKDVTWTFSITDESL